MPPTRSAAALAAATTHSVAITAWAGDPPTLPARLLLARDVLERLAALVRERIAAAVDRRDVRFEAEETQHVGIQCRLRIVGQRRQRGDAAAQEQYLLALL